MVKNDVVKDVYDKLVAKVNASLLNNIDSSDFVLKTKYQIDKIELENKIPNVTDFVKEAKLTELENKMPDISNLAIKTALTTVENKILNVSNLVKKTDYNTKVTETANKLTNQNHNKYIDTQEFNKLAVVLNARLARAKLITKTEFDPKLSSRHRKITSNKTKNLLVQNELNNLKIFDSSYFIGKSHFDKDGTQNYLVFQPLMKFFKLNTNTLPILSKQSKRLSNESIDPPTTNISPSIYYVGNKIIVKFNRSCLKQSNKLTYTHKNIVKIFTLFMN